MIKIKSGLKTSVVDLRIVLENEAFPGLDDTTGVPSLSLVVPLGGLGAERFGVELFYECALHKCHHKFGKFGRAANVPA